jgi:hypothetical protein
LGCLIGQDADDFAVEAWLDFDSPCEVELLFP